MKLDRPVSYASTKRAVVTLLLQLLLLLHPLTNCQCFTTTTNTFHHLRKYHIAPTLANSNNMAIHNVHSNSIIQCIANPNNNRDRDRIIVLSKTMKRIKTEYDQLKGIYFMLQKLWHLWQL